jgi:hypothetical protein
MLLAGLASIREVTAFPKTQKAFDPLTECPSEVDQKQLDELGIDLAPAVKAKRQQASRSWISIADCESRIAELHTEARRCENPFSHSYT